MHCFARNSLHSLTATVTGGVRDDPHRQVAHLEVISFCPRIALLNRMARNRGGGTEASGKVFIGDLGNDATKEEIESAFGYYGRLRDVWVARNPPGFAFAEFEDPRDAEDAVRNLDGKRLCGHRVRVEISTGRAPRTRRGRGGGGSGGAGGRRAERNKPERERYDRERLERDRYERVDRNDRYDRGYDRVAYPPERCYRCGRTGHFPDECEKLRYGGGRARSPMLAPLRRSRSPIMRYPERRSPSHSPPRFRSPSPPPRYRRKIEEKRSPLRSSSGSGESSSGSESSASPSPPPKKHRRHKHGKHKSHHRHHHHRHRRTSDVSSAGSGEGSSSGSEGKSESAGPRSPEGRNNHGSPSGSDSS